MPFLTQFANKFPHGVYIDNTFVNSAQYIKEKQTKNKIVLHHTAGSPSGIQVFRNWQKTSERVATCVCVTGHAWQRNQLENGEKDGTIVQGFDDEYWAPHIGAVPTGNRGNRPSKYKFNDKESKSSLAIEICSYGYLELKNGKFINYAGGVMPASEVIDLVKENGVPFKGYRYFHRYSDAQIDSVVALVKHWGEYYGIDITYREENMFPGGLKGDTKNVSGNIIPDGGKGLFTHNSYRTDKTDIYPDPRLIAKLKQLTNPNEKIPDRGPVTPPAETPPPPTPPEEPGREERTESPQNNPSRPVGQPRNWLTQVFPPIITPRVLRFRYAGDQGGAQETVEGLGYIPFVWYNSFQIEPTHIIYLKVTTTDGIPVITLVFSDALNLMKDQGFPLDDTKISVFLNPRSQILKPIRMDFKILNFSINGGMLNITGSMDVSSVYVRVFKSYREKTSYETLFEIARENGLGYVTNLESTDDKMNWISPGLRPYKFVQEVVKNSYMSDETFLISYIDLYYNLVYVDLEKELKRDIRNELGIGNMGLEDVLRSKKDENVTALIFTNDFAMGTSNNYFFDYKIINNSTFVSLEEGYYTRTTFYNDLTKELLTFDVDSIQTDGAKIILKGQPQELEFYKKNINYSYNGKLDTDNAHKNYNYSLIQNKRNIVELQKLAIDIKLRTPNYNIYKFQKVFVLISNQQTMVTATHINNRLSGEWLIIDIIYELDNGSFTQTVRLVKRDLELSQEELDKEGDKTQKPKENASNTNEQGNNEQGNELTDQELSEMSDVDPALSEQFAVTATASQAPIEDDNFPLTLDIYRKILTPGVNAKIIQKSYPILKEALIRNDIKNKIRINAFMSQVNSENGFLRRVSPTTTDAEISQEINKSVRFWRRGSTWGDLNSLADRMNLTNPIDYSIPKNLSIPNSKEENIVYGTTRIKNFAKEVAPNDTNLLYFTLICFGVNNSYKGYKERLNNWNELRNYFI